MNSQKRDHLEKTYERILNVGFCLIPYEDLSDIIAPNPMVYGTAKDERILSFEGVEALFKAQLEQVGDMKPSIDRKRITMRISNDGNHATIVEEITLTISSPEVTHTIFMRASCVMEYLDNRWQLTHWHTSTPVETENDPWHMEEWKREKEKLQKLVDQQTADLNSKNKELEIEASIERVRAVAMGMNKPEDMLKVCRIISDQLQQFGVEHIRNVQTVIINEDRGTYHNYQYFTAYNKESVELSKCNETPVVHAMINRMLESADAFFTTSLKGEELSTFREYRKHENQFPDPLMDDIDTVEGHFFSIGPGGLGITLYHPLNEDGLGIFKRFYNVFSLAYRRFRDIEQAEAQAREAQIQLALERVRAKTMAMKTQSDLLGIVELFGQQLIDLNVRFTDVTFIEGAITKDRDWELWSHIPGADNLTRKIHIPYVDTPYFTKTAIAVEAYEKTGNPIQTKFFTKEEKDEFLDHYWKYAPAVPEKVRELVYANPGSTIVDAFLENVTVSLVRSDLEPFTEEELSIFERFSKEFKQTYTRYLDIKKAEAQARESEIQLALERVRARTMAMQKSEELAEASQVLDQQVRALGIETWGCAFHIYADNDEGDFEWFSGANGLLPFYKTPREEFFLKFYEKGQQGEKFHVEEFKDEDCKAHYDFLKTIPVAGNALKSLEKSGVPLPTYQIDHIAFFNHGYVLFITYQPVPEAHDIFQRFAKVFEQTYTRFLDLQKAEAQARESQIEAALEKVRSRSLAMHTPNELGEVVSIIVEKLKDLDVVLDANGVVLCTYFTDSKDVLHWIAAPDFSFAGSYLLPYFDHPIFNDAWQSRESGALYFSKAYSIEDKNSFFEYAFEYSDYKHFPEDFKKWVFQNDQHILSFAWQKNSAILIPSHTGVVPSPDEVVILKRFAKVFEQSFIRFLDLQKAESQAREAQIEVAVERVRAKALAMHKSTEILQVAVTLKEQMEGLNLSGITAATIYLEHDDNKIRVWDITELKESEQGPQLSSDFTFRLEDTDPGLWVRRVWNANEKYSVIEMSGDDFIKCEKWIREFDETAADNYREFIRAAKVEHTWHPTVQLEKGKLNLDFTVPPPVEMEFILPKMGAAFDLAYRRFLDLEKAEAQAKEAKIEAALERVRSRSLAMHHSSELSAVVDTLLGEFTNLEFTLTFCIINLIDEQDMSNTVWAANPETGKDPESYYMKFEDYPFHHAMWDAWKAQKKRFVYTLEGEEKKLYDEYLYNDTEFRRFPKHIQEANKALERYVARFTFFKYSGLQTVSVNPISEDELEILERFGRVFEQAYTRFLDLKKAEAQAREAQIETALEKVRSRSMAMHNSQELKEVALELRKQMGLLGQKDLEVCAIHLYGNDEDSFESWSAMKASDSETEIVQTQAHFPKRGIRIVDEMVHHYTIGTKDYVLVNEGEKIAEWFKVLKKHAPELHASILDSIGKVPVKQLKANWAVADFSGGALVMVTYGETDEVSRNLLRRSANVFEQAYVRFLDLQKAENQVRESQIEASLERVRSKALAMHNTEDLRQTITSIFEELKGLNIKTIRLGLGLVNPDSPEGEIVTSRIDEKDQILEVSGKFRLEGHPVLDSIYDHFKQQQDHFPILEGEEINSYYTALQGSVNVQGQGTDTKHFGCFLYFKEGCLYAWSAEPHSEGQIDILKKFSRVVEITYRRYIELQKAEEQAKEAQIEASLERIRAKAMAMHQSDELDEVLAVLCEQFDTLSIFPMSTHMTVLDIANNKFTFRETGKFGNRSFGEQTVALDAMDTWKDMVESWKSAEPYSINSLHFPKETLPQVWEVFHESFASMPEGSKITPDDYPDGIYHTAGKHPFGYIGMNQVRPATEKEEQIVIKFANEFGRAYQRFLDLQKAEAQAREAQIVASMERVRAATMAMHQSNELSLVLSKLFEQFDVLGIKPSHAVLTLIDKEKNTMNFRTTGKNGYQVIAEQEVDLNVMNAWVDTAEKWKKSNPNAVNVNEFPPEILPEVWEVYKDILASMPKKARPEIKDFPNGLFITEGYCRFGYIGFAHHRKPTKEEKDIVRRIAAEFGTLYQRFLDLKKSEAQAREAQIETALEKVRAQSMAMQHSNELQKVIESVYDRLLELGIETHACTIITPSEHPEELLFWFASSAGQYNKPFHMPNNSMLIIKEFFNGFKNKRQIFSKTYSFQEKNKFFNYIFKHTDFKNIPENRKQLTLESKAYSICNTFMGYSGIQLNRYSDNPFSKQETEILVRFGKVFEQAYTRFLDLQKAEAQAREAQIEAALEKVRSRSLAMHKSDELNEVVSVLFERLKELQIPFTAIGIGIYIEGSKDLDSYVCGENEAGLVITNYRLPYFENQIPKDLYNALEKQLDFYVGHYSKEEKDAFYNYVIEHTAEFGHLPEDIKSMIFDSTNYTISMVPVKNAVFNVNDFEGKVLAEEDVEIIQRFARVFDQAYTRFLDLQKAEAQAREAQVEVALEKVRSRTMGMLSSDELPEVANMLFLEVQALGINAWSCGYNILNEDLTTATCAMSSEGTLQTPFQLRLWGEASFDEMGEFINNNKEMLVQVLGGEALVSHYTYMKSFPDLKPTFDEIERLGLSLPTYQINHLCKFSHGFLLFITYEKVPDSHDIFKRFTKVFDQTYTRFLDLQKAEARAREAQIQTALERVRSHSMGMQSTSDFANVTTEMFNQLRSFGEDLFATGIVFCDKHEGHVEQWHSIPGAGMLSPMIVPIDLDYIHQYRYDQWKAGNPLFSIEIPSDFIEKHFEDIFKLPSAQITIKDLESRNAPMPAPPPWEIDYGASFKHGYILVSSLKPIENMDILPRFAQVFEQAYIRFLDLQKAEAQAREAQIENALEKVRSRSLAMQSPAEIIEVAQLLREEMGALGVEALETSSIYIHDQENDTTQCWFTIKNEKDGKSVSDQMTIDLKATWVGRKMQSFYKSSSPSTSIVMKGKHRVEWIQYCEAQSTRFSPSKFYGDTIPTRTYHLNKFSDGFIGAAAPGDISEESWDLLKRATAVFSFAYTRFRDLQKAEMRAREAQIEMALEKVRSRTMTMAHSSELADTSVIVFKELLNLGIAPNRLFIGIIKDKGKAIEAWATNEDGSKIEKHFQLHPAENKSIQKMVDAWKQEKKSAIIDMSGKELQDYFHYLNTIMQIPFIHGLQQKRRVQTIAYFSGGLIGMAAPEEQPQQTIDLLERFAAVFNLTYTRFNDLKIAEKQALQAEKDLIAIKQARQKAEEALKELQATQTQLVQQEKLASLGQLTAGIAHEIKNPLNFVNNFSEVSNELIDEVFEELDKLEDSDIKDDIKNILEDVKGNLIKVHEHGTRADSIVKSMLQHSRGGSGKMEATDLNALIKEYTNLSFHGMRAKKNPINVEIDLQLDPNIETVSLIGEDFSRVILNLTSNAFDAMRETAEQRPAKLTVRTKQETNAIVIEVEDNGPGIPDAIKDKILQPFFTTKKGTEGTGLGLSITNDIVKAHGGNITISSNTEKTIFTINLKK